MFEYAISVLNAKKIHVESAIKILKEKEVNE